MSYTIKLIHNYTVKYELYQLQVWFSENQLSLDVMKSNKKNLGNRKLTVDISVKINKETINRGYVTIFLGVIIDDKLNWKNHVRQFFINCVQK